MGRGGRLVRSAAAEDIEFVAPRAGLFGAGFDVLAAEVGTGPASFGDEPSSPRWGTALAVLAVVGLLAVGVVAAAPWDDAAAPTPTTAPTPSTAPATTTPSSEAPQTTAAGTLPPGLSDAPTGYLLDPADVPAGYELQWVDRPHDEMAQSRDAVLQLWAEPNATRADGTWLAVEVLPMSAGAWDVLPVAGAARVAVGDVIGTAAVDQLDGVVSLQWPIDATHDARFTAHGWDLDGLLALAGNTTFDAATGGAAFADPSFQSGLVLVADGPGLGWGLASELYARYRSSVTWTGPDGHVLSVTTLVADPAIDKTLYDFLLDPVPGEPFTGPKTFWALGDLTLVVGHLGDQPGAVTVKWSVGDATVLLSGDLTVADLTDLATRVHAGSAQEWLDASRDALDNTADEEAAAYDFTAGPPVGSGTSGTGLGWAVRLSADGTAASVEVTSGSGGGRDGGTWGWYVPLDAPQVQLATTSTSTFAMAVLATSTGATTLHAVGPWGERSEPFTTVTDGTTQVVVAVMDVPELGGFTVTVLDAAGNAITSATAGVIATG